jgi:hypothetical protein
VNTAGTFGEHFDKFLKKDFSSIPSVSLCSHVIFRVFYRSRIRACISLFYSALNFPSSGLKSCTYQFVCLSHVCPVSDLMVNNMVRFSETRGKQHAFRDNPNTVLQRGLNARTLNTSFLGILW